MKKKLYPLSILVMILIILSRSSIGQDLPKPGELLINEFMANPKVVSDTKGEWFELMNNSGKSLLLNGLIIKDDGSNQFVLQDDEPILLLPNQYFLLARSDDHDINGGLNPNYKYSNFTLGNSEDEIILCLPDGNVLDRVAYNSYWQVTSGSSLELSPLFAGSDSNNEPDNWSLAMVSYGYGDHGSPGIENSSTSGLADIGIIDYMKVYPNPCFGKLNIKIQWNRKMPVDISLVNLLGQEIPIFESGPTQEVKLSVDTDWLQKGVWMVRCNYGIQSRIAKVLIY